MRSLSLVDDWIVWPSKQSMNRFSFNVSLCLFVFEWCVCSRSIFALYWRFKAPFVEMHSWCVLRIAEWYRNTSTMCDPVYSLPIFSWLFPTAVALSRARENVHSLCLSQWCCCCAMPTLQLHDVPQSRKIFVTNRTQLRRPCICAYVYLCVCVCEFLPRKPFRVQSLWHNIHCTDTEYISWHHLTIWI